MQTREIKSYIQFTSRGLSLAIMAVLAASAVAASAASAAEPEFKPSTKQAFTGTSGELVMATDIYQMSCSAGTSAGEVTSASTLGSVVLTFTGCKIVQGTKDECSLNSPGAKSKGEIVTKTLTGTLGTVKTSEAPSGVGLLLKPTSGKEVTTIAGACIEPEEEELQGEVAAEVTPIKTSGKTLKLVFVGAAGKNHILTIVVKGTSKNPKLTFDGAEALSWTTTEALEFKSNPLEVT